MAVVAGLRRVLEVTTIADLVASALPASVLDLAGEYSSTAPPRRHPEMTATVTRGAGPARRR